MKSFTVTLFNKKRQVVVTCKYTLRSNFEGTEAEKIKHIKKQLKNDSLVAKEKLYLVQWDNGGYPAGFLVQK